MGPGQKFLTRVGSGQFFVVRVGVRSAIYCLGSNLENFPFQFFFPSGKKNLFGSGQKVPGSKAGWPLIYCGSKVASGWVGSGPISISGRPIFDLGTF